MKTGGFISNTFPKMNIIVQTSVLKIYVKVCSVSQLGRELLRYSTGKNYEKMVYIGDGNNDFCPSTKLSSSDHCLPRRGMAFSRLLESPEMKAKIVAEIIPWDTADDVLKIFERIL
jgi:2-hydroxy-3-keto-5-methylthiopentenyl-1-phosphate phosphatase